MQDLKERHWTPESYPFVGFISLSRTLSPFSWYSCRNIQKSSLSFMMSARTEPPRNTICLRRGGSSIRILNFCNKKKRFDQIIFFKKRMFNIKVCLRNPKAFLFENEFNIQHEVIKLGRIKFHFINSFNQILYF